MNIDEIKIGLNTKILGKEIIYFSETTSTNDIAVKLAKNGAEEGVIVIADYQTGGRGRRGRIWFAPSETCILSSIILRPSLSLKYINILTPIAVVSIVNTINSITQLDASVKWPNDVVIGEKKVSGVLTETRILKNGIDFAVVGIGINVNVSKDKIPLEISEIATSLYMELGYEICRIHLFQEIIRQFEKRYLGLNETTYNEFLNEWKSLSTIIGNRVQIESENNIRLGTALDIDKNGSLIIKLDSEDIIKINNDDLVKIRNIK
jgi:BirA family biotin operon repressor/biotin-[acetyl-CoA-carboxylase] ligase